MSFLYPLLLLLLPLCAALAALAYALQRRRNRDWRKLVSAQHPELVQRSPFHRATLPTLLAFGSLLLGIIALARPYNGFTESSMASSGRNLIIALDISRSMETQDVKPSRLEEARAAAYELIDALPADKIGLLVFSGEADLVVPLTYDHSALRDALEQVNRDWAGYGGTNFGLVLRKAMQDFQRSAPNGSNALVILSDGEDTTGGSLDIAEDARKAKMLVITVGIGSAAGAPIPDSNGENGLWQDAAGKHVISKLDSASMKRFADATGGSYFSMSSGADLGAFAKQTAAKLDKHEESIAGHKTPNELFEYFAGAALLLLVLSILFGTQWRAPRRGHGSVALLLFILLALPAAAVSREGADAYANGIRHCSDQETSAAKEAFSQALLDKDEELQAAAFYALGNLRSQASFDKLRHMYQGEAPDESGEEEGPAQNAAPQGPSISDLEGLLEELKADISPYNDALKLKADFPACSRNRQRVQELMQKIEKEIERMKQEQQNQQQQDQQQNQQQDQQQQDQQKQDQQKQDQQKQDQQKQNQQKQDQQKQDQQKQDQQKQDQQKQDQQKQDQQKQDQQKQDQQKQDQQKQDQQKQDQQKQDQQKQDQQKQDQQKQDRQKQGGAAAQAEETEPMSEDEKAKQRAASILRMHMDEEKGSPIPHFNNDVRPPQKDY